MSHLAMPFIAPMPLQCNGGASPGGRSPRPPHPFLPSSVTNHPSFPSLRHRHPTIVSTVSQLPWGEAARAPPYGHGNAHAESVLSFFGSLGGGAGVDILGGVRSSPEALGGGARPTQQQIWGVGFVICTSGLAWRSNPSALATRPFPSRQQTWGVVGHLGVFCSYRPIKSL